MEPKFKEGEVVYERARPTQELIVNNHVGLIYFCRSQTDLTRKELVFFERELMTKTYSGLNTK
jgi:hypothetical protein